MSHREFIEWQSYYNEEPFLSDRLEIQMARLGQITSLTGMGKIDLPDDYFVVSRGFKLKESVNKKDLAQQVKAAFGVK